MKFKTIGTIMLLAIGFMLGFMLNIWAVAFPHEHIPRVRVGRTVIDSQPTPTTRPVVADQPSDAPRYSDLPIFLPPMVVLGHANSKPIWNCRWHDQEQGIRACEWPKRRTF